MAIGMWMSAVSGLSAGSTTFFSDNFRDSTLRIDYTFSGNVDDTKVAIGGMSKFGGWAGRRHNMDVLPLAGNGSLTVVSLSGDTLYRTSFSSLYQEWLMTDEAKNSVRAMENSFLIPMPKETVDVKLELTNSHRKPFALSVHRIDPTDILIRKADDSAHANRKVKYVEYNGTPSECIDVAICAEGYTDAQYDLFMADAERTVESLRSHEPFTSNMDKFNFMAVFVPSADSGVSVPRLGQWKSTPYSSHYSTFYSDRYLTTSDLKALHGSLENLPYEHIIVLANTDEYGGGGIYNSYTLTTAHHSLFPQVVVHEFGHSFGGLGDEYFYVGDVMDDTYPTDTEPWEPNVTTLVDFDSKWKKMIPEGTPCPTSPEDAEKYPVGLYEGAAYSSKGLYRPADRCRMRSNTVPAFCKVCEASLLRLIRFYTED